jgi:hypothetical protein
VRLRRGRGGAERHGLIGAEALRGVAVRARRARVWGSAGVQDKGAGVPRGGLKGKAGDRGRDR